MDPFFIAAAGSAVLAVALKRKKPVEQVPDETFCPPGLPPISSPAWVEIAKQANAIVGTGGAAAAGIFLPGVGVAIGGAIALGQQIVGFGLESFDQATTGAKQQIRQRLIDSCYGNPPGTIFRRYGARKNLNMTYTLLDLYFVATQGKMKVFPWSQNVLLKKHQASIPIASDVKYFVTAEGPPRCCASRISPAQALANGHKLYSESEAKAFWQKVESRKQLRLLQKQLAASKAVSDAKAASGGTRGSGFLRTTAVVMEAPRGYKIPHRDEVPGIVKMCHPVHGHLDLFCHATDSTKPCVWVRSGAACYTGAEAEYHYR